MVILGPTAAGKSELGLALAGRLGGEIVNYDSVQLYRGFYVGTGKLLPEERRGIPHHLLDVVEPDQVFSAGDFARQASHALSSIRARERFPILVGGTGFYLRALLVGLFEGPPRSEPLRARLAALARRHGREFLHRLLSRLDPPTAERVRPRDTQKIVRALEVCLVARQPLSALQARGRSNLRGFRVFKIGLNPERKQLNHRINTRVERMFAAGLLDETRRALERAEGRSLKPLEALGYRQACAALRGEISREEAVQETQAATRQYAKRQRTWFRREAGVAWFAGFGDDPEVQRQVFEWLREAAFKIAGFSASVRF